MVSLFSRFSISRNAHRRTQSALEGRREEVAPISEPTAAAATATALATGGGVTTITAAGHGIEVAVEFKPLDHPTEPFDHDIPIPCPLPEPSILNDGRIWKERVSVGVGVRRRTDTPAAGEGGNPDESEPKPKPRPPSRRLILSSSSAPEHNILKLLEESGI